ncbi:hypothetical protein BBJ28_00017228, partial [Nothophytophthora sp. Chile5]
MGCRTSRMRRLVLQLDELKQATPDSPLSASSLSEVPMLPLESPVAAPSHRVASIAPPSPPSLLPNRQRVRRRQRQEPRLDHHLSERLEPLVKYLERTPESSDQKTLHTLTQRAIDDLLSNMQSFFTGYASEQRPLLRLAQTGRVVQQIESFHRTLDALTARCGLAVMAPDGSGPSLPRWQPRWRRMRAERLVFFRSHLDDRKAAAAAQLQCRLPQDQLELMTLLKHDAQKFEALLTADELELLDRAFAFVARSNSHSLAPQMSTMLMPEWFVAPYERTKQQLKWQRAAVAIHSAPRGMDSRACLALANTWSRLKHPHIMKLFGACHVGRDRFFVVAEGTPLSRCVGDEGFPLWRALHEAALALRFLHERRVALEALSCADLVLFRSADRDIVMLAGFNFRLMKSLLSLSLHGDHQREEDEDPLLEDSDGNDYGYDDVDLISQDEEAEPEEEIADFDPPKRKKWQAPELLKGGSLGPTAASDIFALGMCVIEAFSSGDVWGCGLKNQQGNCRGQPQHDSASCGMRRLLEGELPPRPAALKDAWQWALVERMCAVDPKDRPSLAEVLASFQVFAEEDEMANSDSGSEKPRKKSRHYSLRQQQPRATSAAIAYTLSEVQAWCDEASESSALNYQLYERLEDVAARLEAGTMENVALGLRALVSLITRFRDTLQRHANEKPLLRLAASRQIAETNLALHDELDLLMDQFGLHRDGASIHSWVPQQTLYREQLWQRMRVSLEVDKQTLSAELDGEQEHALLAALLVFEVSKRSASYSASDLELLQATLAKVEEASQAIKPDFGSHSISSGLNVSHGLPPWFIPPYEVVFNELNAFSREAFGSVHVGKWLNAAVVVKKVVTAAEHGFVLPLRGRRGAKSTTKMPDEDPYDTFLREVHAWFGISHPHVVKLFGACHVGPHQFFVCEFESLGTIDSYVASKPANERRAVVWRLLHQAALGLQHLHKQSIVHADLKCSNILVSGHGVAKVTNFGASSMKQSERGKLSSFENDSEGAVRWKAPECLSGESATFASNVYAFGMCVIEAVSGEVPWG